MHAYLIVLLLLFTGCTTKEEFVLFNKTKVNQKHIQDHRGKEAIKQLKEIHFEYKIRPYDRVSIMVYKHPDISTSTPNTLQQERGILVNSKGDVRLPLIKRINLQGLTQTEAEDTLEKAYSVYIREPDIQIEVLNKRAYVIGEVKKPGEVQLPNEQLTLLQILASVGDLTDNANRDAILIVDGSGNQANNRIVSLTNINSLQTANLMVKPNDIVYVMPNKMKTFNVKIKEATPILTLINQILTPFINIRILRN